MKLWILRPIHIQGDDPWKPWYDRAFGFVVRADSPEQARMLADENGGEENTYGSHPWLEPKYSTCERLIDDGESDVVMRDYASA